MTDLATLAATPPAVDARARALAILADTAEAPEARVNRLVEALFAHDHDREAMELSATAAGHVLKSLCPWVDIPNEYVGYGCHAMPGEVVVVVAGPSFSGAMPTPMPELAGAVALAARPTLRADRNEAAQLLVDAMGDDVPPDDGEWEALAIIVMARAMMEGEESWHVLNDCAAMGVVPGLVALVTARGVQMFSMPLGPSTAVLQPAQGRA